MIVCGNSLDLVPGLPAGSIDAVITDPVWPNAPRDMFPGCGDPFRLLNQTLEALPKGVKRLAIVMRNDSDPRFLAAVPSRWSFFHAIWMQYAVPSKYGRQMGGVEVAYLFGQPIKSARKRHLIPSVCNVRAQPFKKGNHPCPRPLEHMVWLVNCWSDPGETVLDPFAGSGTIEIACRRLGRRSLSIEINPEYAREAAAKYRASLPLSERPNRQDPNSFRLQFSD